VEPLAHCVNESAHSAKNWEKKHFGATALPLKYLNTALFMTLAIATHCNCFSTMMIFILFTVASHVNTQ